MKKLIYLTMLCIGFMSCSINEFPDNPENIYNETQQKSNIQEEYTTDVISGNNLIHNLLDERNKPYVYVITVDCLGEGIPQEAFWTFKFYGYGTGEDGRKYKITKTVYWSNVTKRVETSYTSTEIPASEYGC